MRKPFFEVSEKSVDSLGRNEWNVIKTFKTKDAADRYAKRMSLKLKTEVDVRGFDDNDDVIFHAFYEFGRMTQNMHV